MGTGHVAPTVRAVAESEGAGRPQKGTTGASDEVRLQLCGEVDIARVSELGDGLDAAVARTSTGGRLVVDLTEVEFLDCAALGVVIRTAHRAVRRHVSLELTGDHGAVARVLQLADVRGTLSAVGVPG